MRTETGRNDPCPCGSGKKYRKCCLSKYATRTIPHDPYTGGEFSRHDRDAVLKKLVACAYRLEDRSEEEINWLMSLPQVQPNFHAWLLYDVPLEPTKTFADLFLEREGVSLKSGERACIGMGRLPRRAAPSSHIHSASHACP